MRRVFVPLTLGLIAALLFALPADAAIRWCKADPIVRLNGIEYQIIVSVPAENVPQIDGALEFEISSPEGTAQTVILLDEGYNGHGERVEFKQHSRNQGSGNNGGTTHQLRLDVPKDGDDFPVLLDIYRNNVLVVSVAETSDQIEVSVPIQ